jgi:hypothetical protein
MAFARLVCWLQEKHGSPGADRYFWKGVTLICWCLWCHRNDVVFEGVAPSKVVVISRISNEAELRRLAGLFIGILVPMDKWRCRE